MGTGEILRLISLCPQLRVMCALVFYELSEVPYKSNDSFSYLVLISRLLKFCHIYYTVKIK